MKPEFPKPGASSVEFWEPLYQSAPLPTETRPNVRLTELIRDLALGPGHACDLGCGHGGDALWLASLGWRVTAVDVSATALARVANAAAEQGLDDRVTVEQHDLSQTVPTGAFDLVYACYFHSPVTFDRSAALRRGAQQVAPGAPPGSSGRTAPPPSGMRPPSPLPRTHRTPSSEPRQATRATVRTRSSGSRPRWRGSRLPAA